MSLWTRVRAVEMAAARLLARMGAAVLSQVEPCRACSQKNRVLFGRRRPRCGRCGFPLTEPGAP